MSEEIKAKVKPVEGDELVRMARAHIPNKVLKAQFKVPTVMEFLRICILMIFTQPKIAAGEEQSFDHDFAIRDGDRITDVVVHVRVTSTDRVVPINKNEVKGH